jgi:NAD(P)-dependent dehydrogenase (short-subunit alcohol dehydrogenase family)
MSNKTLVLVTGGNQGLGYYAIQQMSAMDKYHILMGSRDLSKAEKAIQILTDDKSAKAIPANVEPIEIDMSSDESIAKAAKTVEQKYGYRMSFPTIMITQRPLMFLRQLIY